MQSKDDLQKLFPGPPTLGGSQETFLRSTQFGGDIRKFPPNKLLDCLSFGGNGSVHFLVGVGVV